MSEKESEITIKIPVRFSENKLYNLNSNELLQLKNGTTGELSISKDALKDVKLKIDHQEPCELFFLSQKSIVYANIKPDVPFKREGFLNDLAPNIKIYERQNGVYAQINLKQNLYLLFKGTKKPQLLECKCFIPALGNEANSLNHAYTLLSEKFETKRRSHTGNCFLKIYYYDNKLQGLNPLYILRNKIEKDNFPAREYELDKEQHKNKTIV